MNERRKVPVGGTVLSAEFKTTLGDSDEGLQLLQQLIYLGQDGTCFTLGYREFGDGRARESFRENATYQNPQLGCMTDITFRNVKIVVYAVSNTGLDFEILEGSDRI